MDLEFKTAIELADFREGFRHGDYGLSKYIFALCTKLGEAKGWDLEAVLPEALLVREERFRLQDLERTQRFMEEREQARKRKEARYIKKYGKPIPKSPDSIRKSALQKLSNEERQALGLQEDTQCVS